MYRNITVTSAPPCTGWNQSDIVYASRPNTSSPFTTWTLSNLATSLSSEGAPHSIPLTSSTADIFVFNRDNGATSIDIMMMKNVPDNPSASSAVPILATNGEEGNPHIERIDSLNLVIFFNNEEIPSSPPDIFFSTSSDNGINWSAPQLATSINSSYYELQPHLFHDDTDWWLYFAAADTLGTGQLSIFKAKRTIPGNWNSWGQGNL